MEDETNMSDELFPGSEEITETDLMAWTLKNEEHCCSCLYVVCGDVTDGHTARICDYCAADELGPIPGFYGAVESDVQ